MAFTKTKLRDRAADAGPAGFIGALAGVANSVAVGVQLSTLRAFIDGASGTTALTNIAGFDRAPGAANGVERAWMTVGTTMTYTFMSVVGADPSLPAHPRNMHEPPDDQLSLQFDLDLSLRAARDDDDIAALV